MRIVKKLSISLGVFLLLGLPASISQSTRCKDGKTLVRAKVYPTTDGSYYVICDVYGRDTCCIPPPCGGEN